MINTKQIRQFEEGKKERKMDVNKVILKEGRKWRCKEHPKMPCDLICLDGDAKDRVVCFNCTQQNQIPISNLISMSYVLAANEQDILEAYPPLKDQKLSRKLRVANLQQSLEEMEVYFKKLRVDFEIEVKAAEQRAKENLIKQESAYYDLLEEYSRIAEVEKLKQLIVSEKETAEQDLDSFIKNKWSKAEQNRKIIAELMEQFEGNYCFQSDKPNRIAKEMIDNLKQINFFQQPFEQLQVALIKSTRNTSQQMETTKVDNLIYQIKRLGTYNGNYDSVFIDPILDPSKKYILHIELEQKPGNSGNRFAFGLIKDQEKDNQSVLTYSMCYCDGSGSFGVTNYIKGSLMQSGSKSVGKHSLEVRIFLNEKILRVSILPDYSSIAELDDPNKIDTKIAYRFFLSMFCQGDMMRITNFRTVREFDEKM